MSHPIPHSWITNLALDVYSSLHQLHRPRQVALLLVHQTQVPGCTALAPPVAKLARYRQALLVVLDGTLILA